MASSTHCNETIAEQPYLTATTSTITKPHASVPTSKTLVSAPRSDPVNDSNMSCLWIYELFLYMQLNPQLHHCLLYPIMASSTHCNETIAEQNHYFNSYNQIICSSSYNQIICSSSYNQNHLLKLQQPSHLLKLQGLFLILLSLLRQS